MRKKWVVRESNGAAVREMAQALNVSFLTAKVLYHRGIRDAQSAKNFLEPEAAPFHDPFAMKGMQSAVERIARAIDEKESVCVYGDYDVDGMSASAILIRALRKLGGRVQSYIPTRDEGYGLNIPALEKISADGVELLISVDCGITNEREIAAVAERMDVIVTDHHLPALDDVTSAVAVVNPNQRGCNYPDKNLCGAGVAFKLSQALMNYLRGVDIQTYTTDIELAAMATVADLVPLKGENRKIVRMGLQLLRQSQCVGLRALVNVSCPGDKKISAGQIAFQIAPRLNSVGRLKSAGEGLNLLLNDDVESANETARSFNKMNQRRKDIEAKILEAAEEIAGDMRCEHGGDLCTLVIAGDGWHEGVIGLTASKLVERYNLPTIILTTQDGKLYRGSCRSIPALHMKNALDTMSNLFEQYGGHSQAAGLSITAENVTEFASRFDDYVRQHLRDEDYQPILHVDAIINPAQIDIDTAREFEKFEPYGIGNPRPVLACTKVRGVHARAMGKDGTHLSFAIPAETDNAPDIRAVAWGMGSLAPLVDNEPIDVAYEPSLDEWQGTVRIQCNVSSLEPVEIAAEFPDRQQLLAVYNFLRRARVYTDRFDLCALVKAFNNQTEKNFSVYTFAVAVTVFEELGLVVRNRDRRAFDMPRPKNKLELTNSRTFRLGRRERGADVETGKVISLDSVKRRSLMT